MNTVCGACFIVSQLFVDTYSLQLYLENIALLFLDLAQVLLRKEHCMKFLLVNIKNES